MINRFAAGDFRDMTRIAENEPDMWVGVLLTNKTTVSEHIDDFKNGLDGVAELILRDDADAIWSYFSHAEEVRKEMNIYKRDGVESGLDIFVGIPDKKGVILEVLELPRGALLVNAHINGENHKGIDGIL